MRLERQEIYVMYLVVELAKAASIIGAAPARGGSKMDVDQSRLEVS